ncbi:30S ribosomal protein S8 [Candidatus Shikimatogenerans silvanidophilus]|uniref:30S ribosomal protein S8 n=1 Tax=Candidatus Shikimatogenerans silvanidophilus TaxID=2782547 RepID=UPI001BA7EA09|nr:30S ribosomal protein S8 [Candidatus Shikimatogenerans silvanidophilus]
MYTDTISDYLTRIRNSLFVGKYYVDIPYSKIKKEITKILYEEGYILNYKLHNNNNNNNNIIIKIMLKYNDEKCHSPVIKCLKRISKPGLRKYCNVKNIPRVLNGLGISIISTSKGLMTGKKAKNNNLGGEILCYIY